MPFIVGVDAAKEIITARLRLVDHGPGYCHFPIGRDLDYFNQIGSERIVKTYRRGLLVREWRKDPGVHNEALDCRVYAYAALQGLIARGFRVEDEAARIRDLPLFARVAEEKENKLEQGDVSPETNASSVIRSAWLSR